MNKHPNQDPTKDLNHHSLQRRRRARRAALRDSKMYLVWIVTNLKNSEVKRNNRPLNAYPKPHSELQRELHKTRLHGIGCAAAQQYLQQSPQRAVPVTWPTSSAALSLRPLKK
jgi:hypothetical protein